MSKKKLTDFGKYNFYDCGSYGLFTLASERFQPSFAGKRTSPHLNFFTSPRTPIQPSATPVWRELGQVITAINAPITVLDVGGYIGTFCIPLALCAKSFGIDVKIHAFEPGPTLELIEINVDINNLSDIIEIHGGAISSFNGYTIYTFSEGGSIGGNVFTSGSDNSRERIVPVETIDSFCKDIAGPLVIKLDTQGHEPKIMSSAQEVIRGSRAVWQIEFLAWCGRSQFGSQTFADMLLDEFHLFEGTRAVTVDSMPSFLNEIDARPSRMADLLLIPKRAEFADQARQAVQSRV